MTEAQLTTGDVREVFADNSAYPERFDSWLKQERAKAQYEVRLHIEAVVRFCFPDDMTPAAKRAFQNALGQYPEAELDDE